MTLKTLADVRALMERNLSADCRSRNTWRHVAHQLATAARGGDINDVVVSQRLMLALEHVPCLPQRLRVLYG